MKSKECGDEGADFRLPEGYSRMRSMPDDPPESSAFGMQTPGCTCFLMLFLIAPGYAVPLEDAAPLIDGIHGLLGDDQGLVEARCGRTSFGRALAYAIVKTAEQTDGVQYCFTLQAAYPSFVLNTQGFFDEAGTTGLRDAAFFEEAVGEGLVSGDGRGWRRDPYDPSYVRGTS